MCTALVFFWCCCRISIILSWSSSSSPSSSKKTKTLQRIVIIIISIHHHYQQTIRDIKGSWVHRSTTTQQQLEQRIFISTQAHNNVEILTNSPKNNRQAERERERVHTQKKKTALHIITYTKYTHTKHYNLYIVSILSIHSSCQRK